jgi:hypothetical protein
MVHEYVLSQNSQGRGLVSLRDGVCASLSMGNGCRISDSPLVINLGKALALEVDEDVHIESAWWERGGFMSSIIPSMRDWRPHRCITATSKDRLSGRTERSES